MNDTEDGVAEDCPNEFPIVGSISNLGQPLRFSNVEPLCGVSVEPASDGHVKMCTRLATTSDDPMFHKMVSGFTSVVNHLSQQAGMAISLDRANTVLMVMKADDTAELWIDTAAVVLRCSLTRSVTTGMAIFAHDIADITAMTFPCVDIQSTDRVWCLFRQDWGFGLAFDFNTDGNLDLEGFNTALGSLYRQLKYRHLYQTMANQTVFDSLVGLGWFPFVEIIAKEFKGLADHCSAGFDVSVIEASILESFDESRMQKMMDRWALKPHFATRAIILQVAVDAFNKREPIAAIKILLTEIEGVLADAYRAANDGKSAKLKDLLIFAIASAEQKSGDSDTLFFSAAFARYLTSHTFANFDPTLQTGTASSRHAVGHGAATAESYTMTRALQAILTLDQLAFYT